MKTEIKNGKLYLEIEDTITTPLYWDCECRNNFIHPHCVSRCKHCGVYADEQPDSRIAEIIKQLLLEEKQNESRN